MSRIGRKPIHILEGITINLDRDTITAKGPKGSLTCSIPRKITLKQEDDLIIVERKDDLPQTKALHGLIRSLVQNIIIGITSGYEKELQLVGTGYRVAPHPEGISLTLGFSHPIIFKKIDGIEIKLEGNNKIFVSGIDKQLVGQVAANIRALRPPETYKGKGVRYADEEVRTKPGKTAKAAIT
ncbi:50S ribosomal protein L6 [Patescibacteria group bacterium]|nr:50S ribosomal protein L6 [Patescibacteria group bacterium]